jgi:hypothetical protein
VSEDAVEVSALPNGVRVQISGASCPDFDQDFDYDHRKEGCFRLRMDACNFEDGVLILVLERTSQLPRMRLWRDTVGPLVSKRAALVPIISEDTSPTLQQQTPPRAPDLCIAGVGFDTKWHRAGMARATPELYMMTPSATLSPKTPGAYSTASGSDLSSHLWLDPQAAPAASRTAAGGLVVVQPMPPPALRVMQLQQVLEELA